MPLLTKFRQIFLSDHGTTVGPPNNETFGTQKFFHYTKVFIEEKFFRSREISWYIKYFSLQGGFVKEKFRY